MNSNNYMANSPAGPQPNSWQPPDHSPRPERRALSLPGGLPPTITPPPPVAQFGATAASPAKKDKNPPQHDKKEEAAFPELGRAGSVLGWFVNWVSPPATAAENSPSAASAATAEGKKEDTKTPPVNPPPQGYPLPQTVPPPPTIYQSPPGGNPPQSQPPPGPQQPQQQFHSFNFAGHPPPLSPPDSSSPNAQWGSQGTSQGTSQPGPTAQGNYWAVASAQPPGNVQAPQQSQSTPWGPLPQAIPPAGTVADNRSQPQGAGGHASQQAAQNPSHAPPPPQPQFAGPLQGSPAPTGPPPQIQGSQQLDAPGSQPSGQGSVQRSGHPAPNPLFQIPEPPVPNQQAQQNLGQGSFQFAQPSVPQSTPPRAPSQINQQGQDSQAIQQGGYFQGNRFQTQAPNQQGQPNPGFNPVQSQTPNAHSQAPQPTVLQPQIQQRPEEFPQPQPSNQNGPTPQPNAASQMPQPPTPSQHPARTVDQCGQGQAPPQSQVAPGQFPASQQPSQPPALQMPQPPMPSQNPAGNVGQYGQGQAPQQYQAAPGQIPVSQHPVTQQPSQVQPNPGSEMPQPPTPQHPAGNIGQPPQGQASPYSHAQIPAPLHPIPQQPSQQAPPFYPQIQNDNQRGVPPQPHPVLQMPRPGAPPPQGQGNAGQPQMQVVQQPSQQQPQSQQPPGPNSQPPQLFGAPNEAAQARSQGPQIPHHPVPQGPWQQGQPNQHSPFVNETPQFPLPVPQPGQHQPSQMEPNIAMNPHQTPPHVLPPPPVPSIQPAPASHPPGAPASRMGLPQQGASNQLSNQPPPQGAWSWTPPALNPPPAGSQGPMSLADSLLALANEARPDAAVQAMVNGVLTNPLLAGLDIPAYPAVSRGRAVDAPNDDVTSTTLEDLSNRVHRWAEAFGAPPQRQFTAENTAVVTAFLERFRALEPAIILSIQQGQYTVEAIYRTPPFRQTLVEHMIALGFHIFVFFPFYPGLDTSACQVLNNLTEDLYRNAASMKYDIEWRQAVCAKLSRRLEATIPAVQIMRTLQPALEALYPQQGPIPVQLWEEFAGILQQLVNLFRRLRAEKDFYAPFFPNAGSQSTTYDICRTLQQGRIFLCTFPGLTRRNWDEATRSWYEVLIVQSLVVLDGSLQA